MHIEIGIIDPARLAAANATALAVTGSQMPVLLRNPLIIGKSLAAAAVFTVAMQLWSMPVGPSELHLIGATSVYLLFGFPAAMLGFAIGLLAQALFFEPHDMAHLGVNALSLMLPMIGAHLAFGRRLLSGSMQERFTLARVVRLDTVYYAGVSAMVLFWLGISGEPAPLGGWALWMALYMPMCLLEAFISFGVVTLVHRRRGALAGLTEVQRLKMA